MALRLESIGFLRFPAPLPTRACARPWLTLCHPWGCSPPGSPVRGIFPGKNIGVGCHFLLQGIFQESTSQPRNQPTSPMSPALQVDSLPLNHHGSAQFRKVSNVPMEFIKPISTLPVPMVAYLQAKFLNLLELDLWPLLGGSEYNQS